MIRQAHAKYRTFEDADEAMPTIERYLYNGYYLMGPLASSSGEWVIVLEGRADEYRWNYQLDRLASGLIHFTEV